MVASFFRSLTSLLFLTLLVGYMMMTLTECQIRMHLKIAVGIGDGGNGVGLVGGSDLPDSFGFVPLEEKRYTPYD